MPQNIGTVDRVIRIVVGPALLAVAVLASPTAAVAIGLVGAVLLVTGAAGYCVTYRLLSIDTLRGRVRRTHAGN